MGRHTPGVACYAAACALLTLGLTGLWLLLYSVAGFAGGWTLSVVELVLPGPVAAGLVVGAIGCVDWRAGRGTSATKVALLYLVSAVPGCAVGWLAWKLISG